MTVPVPCSGQPLPAGWRWMELGEVCEIIAGQSPPGSTYRPTPDGLPFFQGKADFGKTNPVARIWCVEPRKIAQPGDILISVRAPVGPTNVADVACCIGRGLSAIRCGENADRDFILSVLRHFESVLVKKGSGSTFEAINRDDLESFGIPIPPIAEQRRIAGVLREQMAAVEKARAAVNESQAAADALSSAYLRNVFDVSQAIRWETKRLGDILIPHKDVIHPGDRESGTIQFVGLEHLEPGTGRRLGSLSLDLTQLTGRKPTFMRGQIVYGYLRPYLNKVWIAEFEGCSSVDQFAYDVRSEVADTRFVAWFMRSSTFLRRSTIVTTTGQLPRIGREEIAAVEIALPPLDRQHKMADEMDHWLAEQQKLCEVLQAKAEAINGLPAAILRRAFSGEL